MNHLRQGLTWKKILIMKVWVKKRGFPTHWVILYRLIFQYGNRSPDERPQSERPLASISGINKYEDYYH